MDLKPLQPGTPRLTQPTTATEVSSLIRNWRVGQILEASVLGRGDRGSLLLNIQGITLEASRPPELPFRVGDRLPVQILAKEPQLSLRLLAAPERPAEAALRQALREAVPQQRPQTPLFANLAWTRRDPGTLPPPVRPLLDSLWQSIATRESLQQPATLLAALRASGPFLESRLAAGLREQPVRIGDDLRGQLLRLAAALRRHLPAEPAPRPTGGGEYPAVTTPPTTGTPSPPRPSNPWATVAGQAPASRPEQVVRPAPSAQPAATPTLPALPRPEAAVEELLRQVEGAIARQHNHALHSLHSQAEGRPQWAMELPVRNGNGVDLFDLRIEEEEAAPRPGAPAARRWSVRLAFDLAGLGPVHAIITLQAEQIATRFFVERPETARLFSAWLDHLAGRYRQAGLEVGALECRCGPAPGSGHDPGPLIEEEA